MNILKKILLTAGLFCVALALCLQFDTGNLSSGSGTNTVSASANAEMRGLWVATVYNLDYPTKSTTDADQLKAYADQILDDAQSIGINAIFLQVRPSGDALYPSEIYPWSAYLTGEQGLAPDDDFDPLEYWIEEAHARGIELHAWVNPYRVTKTEAEIEGLTSDNPAVENPDWTFTAGGALYLDPAVPEVRQLVIDGVIEIIENYDVDGIHLDDYFYPTDTFDDSASFATYGGDFDDIEDWRRYNIDLLVENLAVAIEAADSSCEFGISPAGVWASDTQHEDGSATTTTFSSYFQHYADTKSWVENEWLDYIAPQIYWEIGHSTADFEALFDWWVDLCKDSSTDLYIGMADYKSSNVTSGTWAGTDELERQLDMIDASSYVQGEIHFRYALMFDDSDIVEFYAERYGNESVESEPETATASEIKVYVDGKLVVFDQEPYIENGRTLVPMSAISQSLGATVAWDNDTKTVTATKDGTVIIITIGDLYMTVDGEEATLDVPASITSGRTMLPLSAISRAFGCTVGWDNDTKTVTIY